MLNKGKERERERERDGERFVSKGVLCGFYARVSR